METVYISAIDKKTFTDDEGTNRTVSLGMNDSHPDTLELLGVLPHCSQITFDKANAALLIKWLEALHHTEERQERIGQSIVDLFNLKPVKAGNRPTKHYCTAWGTKTALGVYLSVKRIIDEERINL